MKNIANKLLEVQKEVGAVKKASVNPFFNSNYFDINQLLEVVNPVLSKHNLVLMQPLDNIGGTPAINTVLIDSDSGEYIESSFPFSVNPDPQKMGSAISYYRRYALQSVLGLRAQDDDAATASGNVGKPARKPAPKKAVTSF